MLLLMTMRTVGEQLGIRDYSVAQVAHTLSILKLWLPAKTQAHELSIAQLHEIAKRGLDSQMFISAAHNGPFTKAVASPAPTYPALWNHDAQNETRMVCVSDSQLQVRPGMEAKAGAVWATASRAHISRGFRFNSQPLAVAFTDQESAGGRAWPNVKFNAPEYDCAFSIWGNSTLGLMGYWWHSNRQVAGRGDMTIRTAESLPVLDFRALNDDQLIMAELIFEEFRDKELKPAYLADADPNRALLDRRVVCDCWGSTRRRTSGSAGWRLSGARSRRCMGARAGLGGRGWWCSRGARRGRRAGRRHG